MKFGFDTKSISLVGAAAFASLMVAAAPAAAEPVAPPAPAPAPVAEPAPVAAPAAPLGAEIAPQAVTTGPAQAAAEGVPHLPSLDNLPPGTSNAPVAPSQPRLTYLRDLWHAMQTQEVSGSDALLLLTQRPMVADAAPPPGLPVGPQAPLPPAPLPPAPAPVTP